MPTQRDVITEQFYVQVPESIKLLFDLTSRVDERVKILILTNEKLEDELKITSLRLQQLENKVEKVEIFKSSTEGKFKLALDIFWKLIVIVAGSIIVFKLGLTPTH